MVRYYCDICGTELRALESARIKFGQGPLMVEVITGHDGQMNMGHFCHRCIREAIVSYIDDNLHKPQLKKAN